MTINLEQLFKKRVQVLLQEYSSYLDANEKMDESNFKFVQQYVGKNINTNLADVVEFLEDAVDIQQKLSLYRADHKIKFGYKVV